MSKIILEVDFLKIFFCLITDVLKCTFIVKCLHPDVYSPFPTSGGWVSPGGRTFGMQPSLDGTFIPVKFQRTPPPTLSSRHSPRIRSLAEAESAEPFPGDRLVRTWANLRFQKGDKTIPSRYLWTGITFNVCPAGGDIQNRHVILKWTRTIFENKVKKNRIT